MENILRKLRCSYPNSKFEIAYKDGKNIVLFNNEDLEWDESFLNYFNKVVTTELGNTALENWICSYDYLDIINNGDKTGYYEEASKSVCEEEASKSVYEKEIKLLNLRITVEAQKETRETSACKKLKELVSFMSKDNENKNYSSMNICI